MAFKLPQLGQKPEKHLISGLPHFEWKDIADQTQIGQGSYGLVKLARYKPHGRDIRDVVIKLPHNIGGQEKEFAKEVRLLNSVKGHPNIVAFEAVSVSPYALMTEYVSFSFLPFEDEKVVSSLADFLCHVNTHYRFTGFEHVVPAIAKDMAIGLNFLHMNDIVHRDLKPANFLVSNKHYAHMQGEELHNMWNTSPIVCKIADFGESRSRIIQTQTLLSSRVQKLMRGSPAFMSPAILLPERRPKEATLEQLKALDTWAYGMILFVLANPTLKYPYEKELIREMERNALTPAVDALQEILRRGQRPKCSGEYEVQQATVWNDILQLHQQCTDFDESRRIISMKDVVSKLESASLPSLCHNFNLRNSQSTAVEVKDQEVAEMLTSGVANSSTVEDDAVPNDGTNACVFLALKVCDVVLSDCARDKVQLEKKLEELPHVASEVIACYPKELNRVRQVSSLYSVLDANKLMKDNSHLKNKFEFTEELPFAEGVFAEISRDRLQQKIHNLANKEEQFLAIYTCEPFSFLVGCFGKKPFVLDTHPVPESCGGNGNGQLKVYQSASTECCRELCKWLWQRLANGIRESEGQSLAVIK